MTQQFNVEDPALENKETLSSEIALWYPENEILELSEAICW